MRIVLVTMPWQSLDIPSLSLTLLRQAIDRCEQRQVVTEYYGNVLWAELLLDRSSGQVTPAEYNYVADIGLFHGMGDWIFAEALRPPYASSKPVESYLSYLDGRGVAAGECVQMRTLAAQFIDQAVSEIVAERPDVVGFSTTFAQNVPSLAVAQRLREHLPECVIVFGGANCEGEMGVGLQEAFPFIDFVVRGEGEQAIVDLVNLLTAADIDASAALSRVSSLCWRRDGVTVANPERRALMPIAQSPTPDYGAWFDLIDSSTLRPYLEPRLVVETARGCWWGEKHQCTFCGLNGKAMKFRSKSPEQAWTEIRDLVSRHQVLDVVTVDNIIDNSYIDTLLPKMAASNWDLRVHYEVKANLRREQIQSFAEAGIVHLQPGIESFSTDVLKLMDKGVHACQNVQVVRDAEDFNITLSYNLLYGFPGEDPQCYERMIEELPDLVHLQPPSYATRIALQRFSPHFDDPQLGFAERAPASYYSFIYGLESSALERIVYHFATPEAGISADLAERLSAAVSNWQAHYIESSLVFAFADDLVTVIDNRWGRPAREYSFDPLQSLLYLTYLRPGSVERGRAAAGRGGYVCAPEKIREQLREWERQGLVFSDSSRFVALANASIPVRMAVANT